MHSTWRGNAVRTFYAWFEIQQESFQYTSTVLKVFFYRIVHSCHCSLCKLHGTNIVSGSLMLTGEVHCFEDECFSLAFAIPAVLMFLSISKLPDFCFNSSVYWYRNVCTISFLQLFTSTVVFVCGTRLYVRNKPQKADALLFFHVPWCALVGWICMLLQ